MFWENVSILSKPTLFDFVIASVHLVNGVDPYLGEYYADKPKKNLINYTTGKYCPLLSHTTSLMY